MTSAHLRKHPLVLPHTVEENGRAAAPHQLLRPLAAVTAEGFPVQKTLSVDVKITAKLRDPYEYWNDSEHLSSLAASDSTTETMLAAASVLAAAANIDPSYYINYAEQTLQLFLTIHPSTAPVEEHDLPEFRFRDPYQSVSTILKEFFDFLGAI